MGKQEDKLRLGLWEPSLPTADLDAGWLAIRLLTGREATRSKWGPMEGYPSLSGTSNADSHSPRGINTWLPAITVGTYLCKGKTVLNVPRTVSHLILLDSGRETEFSPLRYSDHRLSPHLNNLKVN